MRDLPHRPNDRDYAITEQDARQIRSFYTAFSLPEDQNWVYRDARVAENVRWWHSFTRNKVIYWAASAHTANAPRLRVSEPPVAFRSAGSYLRAWYGDRYRSIGCTFDHGTTLGPLTMPPAPADWFDVVLHARTVTPTQPLVS